MAKPPQTTPPMHPRPFTKRVASATISRPHITESETCAQILTRPRTCTTLQRKVVQLRRVNVFGRAIQNKGNGTLGQPGAVAFVIPKRLRVQLVKAQPHHQEREREGNSRPSRQQVQARRHFHLTRAGFAHTCIGQLCNGFVCKLALQSRVERDPSYI